MYPILKYDSMDAMLADTKPIFNYRRWGSSKWWGCSSTEEAIRYVRYGADPSDKEYKEVISLINKIDSSGHTSAKDAWVPDVMGAYPMVPEYLAGEPAHMRRRVKLQSEQAPIKIVVETTVSSSVSRESIIRRGTAIAALAMRMQEERAVELWAAFSTDKNGSELCRVVGAVRLDTGPLSMRQVVAVLCTAIFNRSIMFAVVHNHTQGIPEERWSSSGWGPWGYGESSHRTAKVKEDLGLSEQDLFISGGYLMDEEMFNRDPIKWVETQLAKYRTEE